MHTDLNQRIDNIIHANQQLNQQIKTLTDITITLHQSNTLMAIRVDTLQKELKNHVEKNIHKN